MTTTSSVAGVAEGTIVGDRYRLIGLLGRGGMAEVFDAVDERLGRPVAVKVLRPDLAARADVRARFQAEARAAAGISHPNAVAVYDTGEHHGTPYLVMERLPGDTLADCIAAGPVDDAWLVTAAQGVAGALAEAHAAGIVHRDVKPGNVLIAADGTAKITDFGIAKSIHRSDGDHVDLTETGQLLGTPAYLAPERLEGQPATPAADLWAMGVVLYEALTGTKPFVGRGPLDVAHAIVTGSSVPLADVRPDLDPRIAHAVERAMAHDPRDRFRTAGELAAALGGGPADPTVDVRAPVPGDGTVAMPIPLQPDRPDRARPVAVPPPRPIRVARFSSWPRLAWAAGIILLLVLYLVARSSEAQGPQHAASSPTSTPASTQATSPAQGLAAGLRDLASRLDVPNDGARADDLAAALNQLADHVQAGAPGEGGEATGLIITVAAWYQTGQLNSVATAQALDLLRQVPGVNAQSAASIAAATQPQAQAQGPAATAPAPAPAANNPGAGAKGKGKGKDRD